MRLLSCHVENYGNISDEDYLFDGALTEFCRENGYGKTTLASFIKAMFYGLPAARKGSKFNDRHHFYPFGGGKFGGNLLFEKDGREYKIERFFDRSSGTRDSLKVYRDGNATDEFGAEPGKSIFGLDEESFERTIFLTSEGIEISSTSDISAKLNHYVDHTDENHNFDTAVNVLVKAGKELKASRGKNDLISRQQAKIRALRSEIENLSAISEELDRIYRRREELAAGIQELEEQEKEAGKRRAVLQKWEVYDTYIHSLEEEKERVAQMAEKYPGGIPESGDIRILRACGEKLMLAAGKLQELSGKPESRDEWMRLSEALSGGIPSEAEFTEVEKQISGLDVLRIQMKELREKEPAMRERELLDRFEGHFPGDDERERLNRYARQYKERLNGQKRKMPAQKASGRKGKKDRIVRMLRILCLLMALPGIAALFLLPQAGYLLAVIFLVILAVCGFLSFRMRTDQRNGGDDARLREEAADLEAKMQEILASYGYCSQMGIAYDFAAFGRDLEEYEDYCEAYDRRERMLEEKEQEYRELSGRVAQFFWKYGVRDEADRRSVLGKFRADVEKYRSLKQQADELEVKRAVYTKQKEECRMQMEDILAKYQLRMKDNPGEQAVELAGDRAGYEHALQNIRHTEEKAEEYRMKNDLINRPEGPEPDMEHQMETLSKQRNSLAAVDREIAEAERRLEVLPERQNQAAVEEERLEGYKAKYEIYTAAAKLLKKAEQNLKNRYIQPIREQFCRYSEVLEKTLGEKITMDRDFRIFYERGGENHTEKHLSDGQRSICQLCFRLALIDNMFEKEKPFLIMDDPFTGLDAPHMGKIAGLLTELAGDRQIIYFCCHESRKVAGSSGDGKRDC